MLWSCWRSCSLSWPCPWHWLRPSPFPFIEHETPSRARNSGKIAYAFFDVQFVWGNFMFQFMICRGSPRPSTDLCRQHKKFVNWHHLIGWKICFMFYVPIRMSPVSGTKNNNSRVARIFPWLFTVRSVYLWKEYEFVCRASHDKVGIWWSNAGRGGSISPASAISRPDRQQHHIPPTVNTTEVGGLLRTYHRGRCT